MGRTFLWQEGEIDVLCEYALCAAILSNVTFLWLVCCAELHYVAAPCGQFMSYGSWVHANCVLTACYLPTYYDVYNYSLRNFITSFLYS
jgi:hypothetical protein